MTTDDESIIPPDNFSVPELEEKEKRGRKRGPKLRRKLPEFEEGEKDRLVAEFLARGGKVSIYPMAGDMQANLRMRGKNAANRSLVEIVESAASVRREDRDFLS